MTETLTDLLEQAGLRTQAFGRRAEFHDEVDSTNHVAARLAEQGAAEGTLVVARVQRAGRGRGDHAWESPAGGLYATLILRPTTAPDMTPALTLALAVAAAEALERVTGAAVQVRWPNDLFVGDRKLGGLLAEARWSGGTLDFCCLGLGINTNAEPADFSPEVQGLATSLRALRGDKVAHHVLLAALLQDLEDAYAAFQASGLETFRNRLQQRCATLGRAVRVHRDGAPPAEGRASEVTPRGSLVVQTATGPEEIWTSTRTELLPTGPVPISAGHEAINPRGPS